jgi:outer membrane protein OmpA-like peptidoglycan-associated protein
MKSGFMMFVLAAMACAQETVETAHERAVKYFQQAKQTSTISKEIALLEKSLEQEKTFEACWALGNTQMEAGDYARALAAFRKGLESTSESHAKARAYFKMGLAAEKMGQLLQAAEYLKGSLEYEDASDVGTDLARIEVAQSKTILKAAEIQKALFVSREFIVRRRQHPGSAQVVASIELRVNFALDHADLSKDGKLQAEELGKALKSAALGEGRIVLVGHTDKQGSHKHNDELSLRRAETIKAYLSERYDLSRLAAEGAGKHQLLAQGDSEDDHARNRRVEVRLEDRR